MRVARRDRGEILWLTDLKATMRRILLQREAVAFGFVLATLVFVVAKLVQAFLLKE